MKAKQKTKAQLIEEVEALRLQIAELQALAAEHQQAAEALRESEARYRNLFENAVEGVFRTTPAGRFLDANPALVRMLGYESKEEMLALRIPDDLYMDPTQRQRLRESYEASGTIAGVELQWKKKTGEPITVSLYARTICNEHGEVVAYEGMVLDVTDRKRFEVALKDSEERYRIISESISDYAFSYCPEDDNTIRIEWITESFTKVTGYTIDELRSQKNPWALYIYPEDLRRISRTVKATEPGQSTSYEFRIKTKGGETRWIQSHVKVVGDEHGNIVRVYGAARDITERKLAEDTLRESQELFLAFMNNSPAIAYMKDEEGRFIYINKRFEDVFSIPSEEVIGKTDFDLWPADIAQGFRDNDKQVLTQNTVTEFPETTLRGTEERHWFSFKFPFVDGSGRRILAGISIDITERMRAEDALYTREQEFKALVEHSPDIITRFDKQARHMYVNAVVEQLTGIPPHTFVGKTHQEIRIDEKYWKPWHDCIRTVFATGQRVDMEFDFPGPLGTRYYQARFVPEFAKDGPVEYVLGTARDVTEQKRAEEERQKLQHQLFHTQKLDALGTLAGGLAHDFNNLLSAIVGFTELVREEVPRGSVSHNNLEEVLKASTRAKTLVQQLLAFSHSGLQEPTLLDLRPIVEETLTFLRVSLSRNIEVSAAFEEVGGMIWGNASQLQQVVMNLCMNAVQAVEEHGGQLEVTLRRVDVDESLYATLPQLHSGPHLCLTVHDTGAGIPQEIMERIFEPFFTTKPVGKGSGLGLAVVHGIVASHSGAVAAESSPGRGTTFRVYFPLIETHTISEPTPSGPGKGEAHYDAYSGH